jgi:transposase
MVRWVRSGKSMHRVATRFRVSTSVVARWVQRAGERRLDRVDFSDHKPGCAEGWNRTAPDIEQRIVELRRCLREESVLGEYGARAIQAALKAEEARAQPSEATINRVLSRHGLQDAVRRIRRPAPPQGWYLPAVMAAHAELDCFDFIEDLKIAEGPLVDMLTAKSLHGRRTDAWVLGQKSAKRTAQCLRQRWKRDGLPGYAQFDNDTVFQGAHQFADTVGRVSRLCLALGVIPVFVPPLEHGMQNTIESFNGLWQVKVWQRHHVGSAKELQARSDAYIAAHRARSCQVAEAAPPRRPMPKHFRLNLHAPLRGLMIFIRRTDETGHVHMLGQRFAVSPDWPHRLVRCEVDFDHHCIRCFALRRRAPTEQSLLATLDYHRTDKPFRGEL